MRVRLISTRRLEPRITRSTGAGPSVATRRQALRIAGAGLLGAVAPSLLPAGGACATPVLAVLRVGAVAVPGAIELYRAIEALLTLYNDTEETEYRPSQVGVDMPGRGIVDQSYEVFGVEPLSEQTFQFYDFSARYTGDQDFFVRTNAGYGSSTFNVYQP